MNVCYKRVSVWWSTASERGRGGKGSWCCCCLSQCNWTELSDYKQYSENTQSVSEWLTALLLLIAYQQQQRCQERPVCVCVCVCSGRARVEGVARSCLRHWSLHHHRHIAGFTLAHHTPARCSLWWCLALCRPKQTSSFCQQGQRTSSSLGVSSSI